MVAAGLADSCTIQLAYAIGVAKPLSIYVDLGDNPNKIDCAKLEQVLGELMDLSPRGIRKHLDLNKPIYARTAAYGHFGRAPDSEGGFSWEKTDLVDQLKSAMARCKGSDPAGLTPWLRRRLRKGSAERSRTP